MKPTEHELKEFANALQLSIKTEIIGTKASDDRVVIEFASPKDDDNLRKFAALAGCAWKDGQKNCVIPSTTQLNWSKLTLFLLLTRLNDENMSRLAEIDPSVLEFTKRLGIKESAGGIEGVEKCSQLVFDKMKEKGMTIREMAEATGLTQVSISNFKTGKDIRLSNFIRMIQALGLKFKVN